ncbi:hypothetical protein IQ268_08445 [Oculatella sp. LEGE 06141]|uniref:hypothetical protein n=1 Tax=Oculatella sp. LEGE 06141 TaxID=1828648 RepID=UPI00187F81BF|nr:hypothetical protein [Oculatella sp. LEGE 06141]MBE9178586.1 hypothetical protein [Oculatella sp. LEGE 06141]
MSGIEQSTTVVVRPAAVRIAARVSVGLPGRGTTNSRALETEPIIAAVALSALRMVAIDSNGNLIYADSSNLAQMFSVVGLVRSAVEAGAAVPVLVEGLFSDAAWNWIPGLPIFLGINGTLTQTPPTSGFLLMVGMVISPTQIFIQQQEPTQLWNS